MFIMFYINVTNIHNVIKLINWPSLLRRLLFYAGLFKLCGSWPAAHPEKGKFAGMACSGWLHDVLSTPAPFGLICRRAASHW